MNNNIIDYEYFKSKKKEKENKKTRCLNIKEFLSIDFDKGYLFPPYIPSSDSKSKEIIKIKNKYFIKEKK